MPTPAEPIDRIEAEAARVAREEAGAILAAIADDLRDPDLSPRALRRHVARLLDAWERRAIKNEARSRLFYRWPLDPAQREEVAHLLAVAIARSGGAIKRKDDVVKVKDGRPYASLPT